MAMPRILALLGIPVDFPLEAAGYFDPALVLTNLFKPFGSSERNPLDAEAVDVLRPPPMSLVFGVTFPCFEVLLHL